MRNVLRRLLRIGRNTSKPRSALNIVDVNGGIALINYGGRHYHLHVGHEFSGHRLQYRSDENGGLILLNMNQKIVAHFGPKDLEKKTMH